jgi:adenylosuccinate synthase
LPGWSEDITGCRSFEELPEAARRYVEAVSRWVGRPVCFVSVGPGREAFIVHGSQIEGV